MPGPSGAPHCPLCKERVFYNEEKTYMGNTWHKKCFKCVECSKLLESGLVNMVEEELLCNTCYRRNHVTPKDGDRSPVSPYTDYDDPDCCPRCGRRVYFAEQISVLARKWHNTCFTCAKCSKKLESHLSADHGGEVYCKSCYGRSFGPKGYGYAGGAGTGLCNEAPHPDDATDGEVVDRMNELSMKDNPMRPSPSFDPDNPPKWGGGDNCSRCDGQVYLAEKRAAAGKAFHDKCFNCANCQKKLDSSLLAEKEGEIYCKVCYGKNFGPRGYGYGQGAGALQMAN